MRVKILIWPVLAIVTALLALIGHWETDARPAAPAPADVATGGAGAWWLPMVVVIVVGLAAALMWVAWRRRRAIALPFAGHAAPSAPVRRWHCIISVDGYELGRRYVEFAAADHREVRAFIERRAREVYPDLPPPPRLRIRVVEAQTTAV